jgi:hypothetical protein
MGRAVQPPPPFPLLPNAPTPSMHAACSAFVLREDMCERVLPVVGPKSAGFFTQKKKQLPFSPREKPSLLPPPPRQYPGHHTIGMHAKGSTITRGKSHCWHATAARNIPAHSCNPSLPRQPAHHSHQTCHRAGVEKEEKRAVRTWRLHSPHRPRDTARSTHSWLLCHRRRRVRGGETGRPWRGCTQRPNSLRLVI